jgi:iron(II)-dependent oxidoreductase
LEWGKTGPLINRWNNSPICAPFRVYNSKDGREELGKDLVRGTRGGGHDVRADELTTTHRGRHVSRNPRGGHHNIGFRCAR